MSEEDRALAVATALGKVETTMSHFGESLEEAKGLIRESSKATGDLRVAVAQGLTRAEERQTAQETETGRRFEVVDKRFNSTNHKIDGLRTDLSAHEKLELVGEAHMTAGGNGKTAAVGAAGAGGAVGIWLVIQRVIEFFSAGPPASGGH